MLDVSCISISMTKSSQWMAPQAIYHRNVLLEHDWYTVRSPRIFGLSIVIYMMIPDAGPWKAAKASTSKNSRMNPTTSNDFGPDLTSRDVDDLAEPNPAQYDAADIGALRDLTESQGSHINENLTWS
ncbi:hypothetical protein BC936DRAFT_150030 [Jimgerdemannia flammicorona]|uniref:Uncharacterized protein n=1 Tax=Jimgerdemannia flammicorona TaxID=994334 RepID=A0A433CZM4_9FUNG|nr:hypothetical protein BC936DRAFT_150030 [Jimgerdemannia flammicorona]